jgi:hypothetical protein
VISLWVWLGFNRDVDFVNNSTNNAVGSRAEKREALDDLLQRLGIDEDEIDDLVFEDEEEVPKEGMKCFALARV